MQLFDLDGTILDGNATLLLYYFCLKYNPKVIKYGPSTFAKLAKSGFNPAVFNDQPYPFRFIADTPGIHYTLDQFGEYLSDRIHPIFHERKKDEDIIATGSPEFALESLSKNLGVEIIGTKIDVDTGALNSPICIGDEKLKRVMEHINNEKIDTFYYDGDYDLPIENIAESTHILKKGKIIKSITH